VRSSEALASNFRMAIASMVAALIFSGPAFAQRAIAVETFPDAPTPKQQSDSPAEQRPRRGWQRSVALLGKQSVFFPELAHEKGALNTGQKLQLAVDETVAPSRFLQSAFTSAISQARDALPGYGQGWGGYGKRFGSSVASSASTQAFSTFLLPSLLHQDPRYFVKLHGTPRRRTLYAIERVLITRNDDRHQTVNWSGLLGGLMAEGLANSYLPDHERTPGRTFDRFGIRVGFSALNNVVKEYWPTIFRGLRLTKVLPDRGSDPTTVTPDSKPPQLRDQ
jgi:hypothetical protein